jgi:hypothetical protein
MLPCRKISRLGYLRGVSKLLQKAKVSYPTLDCSSLLGHAIYCILLAESDQNLNRMSNAHHITDGAGISPSMQTRCQFVPMFVYKH